MIFIYDDEGVSTQSVQGWYDFFSKKAQVKCASGQHLQDPDWIKKARLLIIPGGRSLPFYEALGVAGNQNIRAFVEEGGAYLGVCAGAYYAARQTIFAKQLPQEICAQGVLHFFEGDAIGPVFSPEKFAYQSERGASVVNIVLNGRCYPVYFNGGCYFSKNDFTLATYEENGLPAIIAFQHKRGHVLLMGVHPELDSHTIPNDTSLHHEQLRTTLKKTDRQRRELLEKIAQECYDFG